MRILLSVAATLFSVNAMSAQLQISDNVDVVTINGNPVSSYNQTVQLGDGPQVVAVQYNELFEESFEYHEFVRSDIQIVRFNAESGEQYVLSAPMEMDIDQARDFASDPAFKLITLNGRQVAHKAWSRDELLTELLARP